MARTASSSRVDLLFRAFSDRTRLRILSLLRDDRELCVCDLISVLRLPQAKISRHLAYLRRAKLVIDRKDGLWVHYRLAAPAGEFHRTLLKCLSCCFNEVPELARDADRLGRQAGCVESARGAACCP